MCLGRMLRPLSFNRYFQWLTIHSGKKTSVE